LGTLWGTCQKLGNSFLWHTLLVPTHKKTREGPFTPRQATSHWLHGNSIPNIGCHYFWPGLLALPKNTLHYLFTNFATLENLEMAREKKDWWLVGRGYSWVLQALLMSKTKLWSTKAHFEQGSRVQFPRNQFGLIWSKLNPWVGLYLLVPSLILGSPNKELSFELCFLLQTNWFSLRKIMPCCRFSLNLPLFGLGPSSKGLGTNFKLSTIKIAWIHWSLDLGLSSKVALLRCKGWWISSSTAY
jgi:hypothetical protein